MSTPDARLSAAERAALADLEAAAAAADPSLAARLRGSSVWRTRPLLSKVGSRVRGVWTVVLLRGRFRGIPLSVVGLLFMALGLDVGLVLSLLGLAMTVVGLRLLAEVVRTKLAARAPRPDDD